MNDDKVDAILRERFSTQADALQGPDLTDVRRRARNQATTRRHRLPWQRLHVRWGFAVGVALLLGSGFGFALGTSHTPTGSAAGGPVELGFLPESGWNVLQAATKATSARRARPARQAIAANVPLRPEDDADGIPYATLLSLPSHGVVVVASFTRARERPGSSASFPARKLPLRLRDAAPHVERNAQLRPTNPLGQYRLRAEVSGYSVDVNVYFGTRRPAPALITAGQRQLDRLVVRSVGASNPVEERALPMRRAGTPEIRVGARATSRIIDRTFRCTPFALGDGLRDLSAIARPLDSREFQNPNPSPGYLGVSSGGFSPSSDLVSVRADAWQRFRNRPRVPEGVYVNAGRCSSARVSIPLSPKGLPGPPVQFGDDASCPIGGRVLVRVRAVLQSSAPWQRIDRTYAGARRGVVEAALAVRSESKRKAVAFMELGPGGRTRLWVASGCV
jgi:hypothetical protein